MWKGCLFFGRISGAYGRRISAHIGAYWRISRYHFWLRFGRHDGSRRPDKLNGQPGSWPNGRPTLPGQPALGQTSAVWIMPRAHMEHDRERRPDHWAAHIRRILRICGLVPSPSVGRSGVGSREAHKRRFHFKGLVFFLLRVKAHTELTCWRLPRVEKYARTAVAAAGHGHGWT